jgi:hypothetical protein
LNSDEEKKKINANVSLNTKRFSKENPPTNTKKSINTNINTDKHPNAFQDTKNYKLINTKQDNYNKRHSSKNLNNNFHFLTDNKLTNQIDTKLNIKNIHNKIYNIDHNKIKNTKTLISHQTKKSVKT